jgi:hypothetical protein
MNARTRALAASVSVIVGALVATPAQAQLDPIFRTRFGGSLGVSAPITGIGAEKEGGTYFEGQIGVGDDPVVVGLVIGYTTFGGVPMDEEIADATQFELRSDWCPTAPASLAPVYQVGLGLYRLVRPGETSDFRFGMRGGLGVRWAPDWHTHLSLIVAYHFVPDLYAHTRQWVTVGVELMRWTD